MVKVQESFSVSVKKINKKKLVCSVVCDGPDGRSAVQLLREWAMSIAILWRCLLHQTGEWECSIVNWSLEGKETTNGALMKISSLLINVETYTNHAHWQRKETHKHTAKKNRWLCFTIPSFYLPASVISCCLSVKKKKKEKGNELWFFVCFAALLVRWSIYRWVPFLSACLSVCLLTCDI